MQIKKLTPQGIQEFSTTLQKAGVKSSAFEIFFNSIVELIDPSEQNFTQNIQNLVEDSIFESMDDINKFLSKYNDFTNSAIGFINSFFEIEIDDFEREVDPLFDALYSSSDNSFHIFLEGIDNILEKTIKVYDINLFLFRKQDDFVEFLSEYLGDQSAVLAMSFLMQISVYMHEKEIDRDDIETLRENFVLVSSFVSILDGMRKDMLASNPISHTPKVSQKVGRNDPCPCGSGKKYKKCCINKKEAKESNPFDDLELPMTTHFPLSNNDINAFYAIWTRLMDYASKRYCQMRGTKYKKLYYKDKDGKYSFNDLAMKDNYYLELREFLLANFSRLVDDFIDSSRVSKSNQEVLKEWTSYRLKSDHFAIYEKTPHGALVWDIDGGKYYCVYDLYDSLYDISPKGRPISMLLLPFKGRVIYDGLIGSSNVELGQNMRDAFLNDYIALRELVDYTPDLPYQSSTTKVYQLKISIKGAKPPIWRRILIEDDITYKGLHAIIQDIFEWDNGHLHEFETAHRRYTDLSFDDGFVEDLGEDEGKFVISEDLVEVGDKITYLYDFGDHWEHEIKLEAILEREEGVYYPKCIKGKRRGPLEDIGGMWRYNELVEALENGDKESLEEFYLEEDEEFDPSEFDIEEINIRLSI